MPEAHRTPRSLTKLAEGASAEVYAWPQDRVLKLFRLGCPRERVELELRHSRIAHALGIPTPRADGLAAIDGRTGIVFERCDGPTLYDLIVARAQPPEALAAAFFGLQQAIHRRASAALPPLAAQLAAKIARAPDVPDAVKNAAAALLQAAPSGDAVCHGDFHPAQVIVSTRGAMVIGWLHAARGDPAMDVLRTALYLEYGRAEAVDPGLRATFVEAYARRCRDAWAGRLGELKRLRLPVTVARLADAFEPSERRALRELVADLARARLIASRERGP